MGRLRRNLRGLQGCGTLVIMNMTLTVRCATSKKKTQWGGGAARWKATWQKRISTIIDICIVMQAGQ